MEKYPIYTEINNCRDCYRCVRHCPVKAIQIKDAHAEIIYERCTFCGTCVNECPNSVKVIRNDTDKVRMAFLSNRKVIVSLAPSYVSEFIGYEENFVRALWMGLAVSGIGMSMFAVTQNKIIVCIFGFVFFAALPFANNSLDYLVRTNIPDELQGRAWGFKCAFTTNSSQRYGSN